MEKPVFKNRYNPEFQCEGITIWNSRSVATIGIVFGKYKGDIYVLITKRSPVMMDEPNKWCLPSGYLDWDENGWQSVTRELYEETSLYLPQYNQYLLDRNKRKPFYVHTEPSENRQNVILCYGIVYNFIKGPPLSILSYKDHEIDEVKWIKLNDISKYNLAFNHDRRIYQAEEYFSKYLLPWWKRWIKKMFCYKR